MAASSKYFSPELVEESLEFCENEFVKNPADYSIAYSLISLYLSKGNAQEAAKIFDNYQKALNGRGLKREILLKGGRALFLIGDYPASLNLLNRVVEAGGSWPDVFLCLAESHYALGQIQESETHLTKALELNPKMVGAKRLKAKILLDRGKTKLGTALLLETLDEVILTLEEKRPRLFDYDIGIHFKDPLRLRELIIQLREASSNWPDYADYHFKLGRALEAQMDLQGGLESYQKAIKLNKNYALARERFWKAGKEPGN